MMPSKYYLVFFVSATLVQIISSNTSEEISKKTLQRAKRRSYYSNWVGIQHTPDAYVYKPQLYRLTRPYFIPIYGRPGQVPIYYPPQPLLLNPGTPKNNPKIYKGPKYLPPSTDKPPVVDFNDRFNTDDDDYDEGPVWDTPMNRPINPQNPTEEQPTRAPKTSDPSTFPPLVHNPAGIPLSAIDSNPQPDQSFARPRPEPPRQPTRTTTTPRPTVAPPSSVQAPPRPSNCVWAIVACCSAENNVAPVGCFEERGCSGPFWDASPCDSEYARQAVEAALNYYQRE